MSGLSGLLGGGGGDFEFSSWSAHKSELTSLCFSAKYWLLLFSGGICFYSTSHVFSPQFLVLLNVLFLRSFTFFSSVCVSTTSLGVHHCILDSYNGKPQMTKMSKFWTCQKRFYTSWWKLTASCWNGFNKIMLREAQLAQRLGNISKQKLFIQPRYSTVTVWQNLCSPKRSRSRSFKTEILWKKEKILKPTHAVFKHYHGWTQFKKNITEFKLNCLAKSNQCLPLSNVWYSFIKH